MTDYQKLIDTISQELYHFWQKGSNQNEWDEDTAKVSAHKILTYVEAFQSSNKKQRPNHFI